MALTTPNMSLKVWNLLSDLFSHTDLQTNWSALDVHDHSSGKGVQINGAGIANQAVTAAKIASGTITATQLAPAVGQLVPVVATTSATVTNGQLYYYSGGSPVTFTLPSPSTAGMIIGFMSGTSTAPSTAITVTTPSGVILGPGLSAASATLGAPNATVTLLSLQGSWYSVAGCWDTGWVTLSGTTILARHRGDRGYLESAHIGSLATNGVIATLPAGFGPSADRNLGAMYTTGAGVFAIGPIKVTASSPQLVWTGPNITGSVLVDNLSYPL